MPDAPHFSIKEETTYGARYRKMRKRAFARSQVRRISGVRHGGGDRRRIIGAIRTPTSWEPEHLVAPVRPAATR